MKSMTQKVLTLSLLLPLAGCWNFGCTKKAEIATEVQAGQTATPQETCNHVGCTHDHSNDQVVATEEVVAPAEEVVTEEVIVSEEK